MCKRTASLFLTFFILTSFFITATAQEPEPVPIMEPPPDPEVIMATWQAMMGASNAHDVDSYMTYVTDDIVIDYVPMPPLISGKEAARAFIAGIHEGFPDVHWESPFQMISGNILTVEYVITGTHTGEWSGLLPTGSSIQVSALDLFEFEGDKVKKITSYTDNASLMVQLGVMPAPELDPALLVPSFTLPDPEPTGLTPLEAYAEQTARWNSADLSHWAEMIQPDADIFISPLGITMDRDAYIAAQELYLLAFPDRNQENISVVDLGDGWVLAEMVFTGKNDGPYFGIPATGLPVTLRAGQVSHFDANGILTYQYSYFDNITILTQLGLFPPLPEMPELPPVPDYVVQDQITSPSLEGNLLGDPATRDVLVYLPSSYDTSPDKRYPVIYMIHGYTGDHRMYVGTFNTAMQALTGMDLGIDLGSIVAELLAKGEMGEVIIVLPDSRNVYGGSWYERSEVLGDYRTYIARDLVSYIDSNYRTIADREHRAITGHSMGGYGALSLAIEYPDVFGAVAALSPGFPNDVEVSPTIIAEFIAENPDILGEPILISSDEDMWRMFLTNFYTNIMYSMAAAYSPNPNNPPYYVDLPVQYPDKTIVPEVWEKWKERDLVSQIERDSANLVNTPIFIDQGVGETVIMEEVSGVANTLAALDAQGIPYTYDEFPGDHITHLRYQLASALAFLSPHIGATLPPSETEANKALARRMIDDIWNQGALDVADEILATDFTRHDPGNPDFSGTVGPDGYKQLVAMYRVAFPDTNWTVDDMIAEGDMVTTRWTSVGTQTGELMGMPATGLPATVTGISVVRIADGKIVEEWDDWDSMGLMEQLGFAEPTRQGYAWDDPSEVTGDPGDPEANKAIVMQHVEAWNQHNMDILDEIMIADVIQHDPVLYPGEPDLETYKQIMGMYFLAFPDLHSEIEFILAEGDRVVIRGIVTGTHQGELMGIPATGKQVTWTCTNISRIADGKIVEIWWQYDVMGLMAQLTAPPPKYEVYALMVSMFEDGGGIFRFADESRPDVYAKNREDAPVNCIYIKGPGVELVYGPGMGKEAAEMMGMPYYGHEEMLSKIGVSLDQINYVVIDHTCFDHPGGVDLFPNATVIVQKALFDQPNPLIFPMPDGSMFPLALEQDYAKLEKTREEGRLLVVEGDYEIAPGLMTHHAPGHTYETNFLTIDTEDGTVVAAGDNCYTYLNLKYGILPIEGLVVDSEAMLQGYEKIRQVIGGSDALLVPGHEMDVYKRYTQVADRVVKIELPEGDFTNVFFTQLDPGLNMISLPLKPMFQHDARSFAEMLRATMVVRYDSDIGDFVAFIPYAPDDGFPIEGGQGYIVNVPKAAVIPFTGAAWTNNPPFEMAPPVQRTSAWAFVVGGWVLDGEGMSASDGGYTVTVKNLRTGALADENVGESGYFAVAYADLRRKAVVEAGDKVEVAVIDSSGKVVSGPFVHDITLDGIRDAVVKVQLRLGDIIPEKSALLQNYPNPFNPETWIPFHLKGEASVSIRIFNLSGQLVKTLDLGHRDAGVYVSRTKAAYWDGKNEAGEKVSSGIYFYSISAGDFSSTKKMIIRK